MNVGSVIWVIAVALFLGGLGFPVPENPILLGGGYAIYRKVSPSIPSLCIWWLTILCGDLLLFAAAHWLFTRPALSDLLTRRLGKNRLNGYRTALAYRGGWILFLARFTFGIRAVAYIAAGMAHYPWLRFLAVDGLSVSIQVLLFVGIGYFAGERVEWARATGETIALLLGIVVLMTFLATWVASAAMKRLSGPSLIEAPCSRLQGSFDCKEVYHS
jgi:membrane protein DedA with SNARE-associated domain